MNEINPVLLFLIQSSIAVIAIFGGAHIYIRYMEVKNIKRMMDIRDKLEAMVNKDITESEIIKNTRNILEFPKK